MNRKQRYSQSYQSNGSLALKSEFVEFTVLEGGQDRQRQQAVPHRSQLEPAPVRLICVLAIFLTLLMATLSAMIDCDKAQKTRESFSAVEHNSIVVAEGDTLWGIAGEHGVDGCTTAEVVRHIKEFNQLESSALMAGSTLLVPA